MTRYIDADELDKQIARKQPPFDLRSGEKEGFKRALLSVRSMIHTATVVDAQEVKHGKWIDTGNGGFHGDTIFRCSVCNNEREAYIFEENYCPYCGARMDGDENDIS